MMRSVLPVAAVAALLSAASAFGARCSRSRSADAISPPRESELRRFLSAELAVSADAPIIGDDPRAPVEVDEQLMCESCLAIVDHIMTDLKKKVRLALAPACA